MNYFKNIVIIIIIFFCSKSLFSQFYVYSVDVSTKNQKISGWGTLTTPINAAIIRSLKKEISDSILNLCFNPNGLGLNTLGVQIDPKWDFSSSQWVDSIDADQYWLMSEAQKRGVTNFFAIPTSPPAQFKANGKAMPDSTNDTTNYLLPSKYDAYCDYLISYIKGYKNNRGIDINWISLQNEPDTSTLSNSCKFSPEELKNFLIILGNKFKPANITTKIIAPETTGLVKANNYLDSIYNDTIAKQYLSGISIHDTTKNQSNANINLQLVAKNASLNNIPEIWQTQFSFKKFSNLTDTDNVNYSAGIINAISLVNNIINDIYYGKITTFFYNNILDVDSTCSDCLFSYFNDTLITKKQFWAIESFTKLIKPGYIAGKANQLLDQYSGIFIPFFSPGGDTLILIGYYTFEMQFQDINITLPNLCNLEYTANLYNTTKNYNLVNSSPIESNNGIFSLTPMQFSIFSDIIPLIKNDNDKVKLIYPGNGAIQMDTNLIFSWETYTGADSYHFSICPYGNFQCGNSSCIFDTTLTLNSFQFVKYLGNYPYDPYYYWKVNAMKNGIGTPLACSDIWNFAYKILLPDTILLTAPNDSLIISLGIDSILFSWLSPDALPPSYWQLEVSKNNEFLNPDIYPNLPSDMIPQHLGVWYLVHNLTQGSDYWWRVKAHNNAGWGPYSKTRYFSTEGPNGVSEPTSAFRQVQGDNIIVIPNPTTQSATIKFDIEQPAYVSLKLTDMLGNQISLIDNQFMDSGSHSVDWDASGVSAGVYYYVLEAGSSVKTGKVVVIR